MAVAGRRGPFVHLTDAQLAERPVENFTHLEFDEYYQRMLQHSTRDTPLFALPCMELHVQLAAKGSLANDPFRGPRRMRLLNRCKRRAKGAAEAANDRLSIKTPHAICRLELDAFRSHLLVVLDSMESAADTSPIATTLTRQYAHDLILSAAQSAHEEPLPYCSSHMLLLYSLYRHLCEPGDNVFAAAISPQVSRLRGMLLDDATRVRILTRLGTRVLFDDTSHEPSWPEIPGDLLGPTKV
jgi:hypothetical protein